MCLIMILGAAELSAQTSHVRSPVRIRLAPANSDWKPMIGVSVSMGTDTIHLVPDGTKDTVKVLTAGLARIEQSTPGRSNVARRVLIGGLIGGVVGGAALHDPRRHRGRSPARQHRRRNAECTFAS